MSSETDEQIEKIINRDKHESKLATQDIIRFKKIYNFKELRKLLKLDKEKMKIHGIAALVQNTIDLEETVLIIRQFGMWREGYIEKAKRIIEEKKDLQKNLINKITNQILNKSLLWKILRLKPNFPKEAIEQIKQYEQKLQELDELDKKFDLLLNEKQRGVKLYLENNRLNYKYILCHQYEYDGDYKYFENENEDKYNFWD